eukprot:scaffold66611_cov65-Phaeocystis_antarctica.AAC.6
MDTDHLLSEPSHSQSVLACWGRTRPTISNIGDRQVEDLKVSPVRASTLAAGTWFPTALRLDAFPPGESRSVDKIL